MKHRGWDGLPQFSKDMYEERYFDTKSHENYDGWSSRVTESYADDTAHAERLRGYLNNYWFHPSTPISSNAGLPEYGLPISCYTNTVDDSKGGIFSVWEENNWLGSFGGGIGTNWSAVREIGAKIGGYGKSSGIIPFIKVSDSTTLAVSQGGLRRASQAVYLDVNHPEINEFIDIRRPTGDKDRRSTNIHHGVNITDDFMEAMKNRELFDLISPKSGLPVKQIDAFDLWKKILVTRMETGEPYLNFIDNVNNNRPLEYVMNDLSVVTSNLCSEITLYTDDKHSGVCCLVSINLEYWDEYKDNEQFFEDIHRYTDNVLQSFIDETDSNPFRRAWNKRSFKEFFKARKYKGFEKARRSAIRERSIGIGVMGFHQYLQSKNLPFGSLSSKYINQQIFKRIYDVFEKTNVILADQKGTAPLSTKNRNVHVTAVAPTASISTLCNLSSPGIDPRVANVYVAKTNIGSYTIKNKFLDDIISEYAHNNYVHGDMTKQESLDWYEAQWKQIMKDGGSVQGLDWLPADTKEVFLTAYEIDNEWIVRYAGDRAPYIHQAVSTNLFLPADIQVQKLYDLHVLAWELEVKSLYYTRSLALSRATIEDTERECLSCQ